MSKILIIDIETTDFFKHGGKIVEIGIVELDLSNGKKEIIFDKICHEDGVTKFMVEDSWIVKNSTLTVKEVQHSKNLSKLFDEIQFILDSYPAGATAFNNAFDFEFLKNRGFKFTKELPCPMKLSTNVCKIPNPNGYKGFKWPSVEEAFAFFFPDVTFTELHRGADDAFHEADIVYKLYQDGIFKI